ncbi:hypothetical protein CMT41_14850 [Colwellia sp. MT41]|nr:hypothetical protein CMT41_14850 [Colwellia sp. MT41]
MIFIRSIYLVIKVFFSRLMFLPCAMIFIPANANEIGVYYLISAENKNGQGASATDAQLASGIEQLNHDYASLDISFFLLDKIYLTNDDVTGIHAGKWDTDNEEQVRPFIRYGALNVVVADLDGKNGHAYWNYEATDLIEVEPEDLATSTISHEFAHNLGLLHTYQSIDDGPITLLEGVDGWQYGDKVIDTAVDPGERGYYNDCLYSASAVDEAGNAYHPDGFNIMGKGQNTCRNRFSEGQIKRMKRVLLSDKFHLLNSFDMAANPTCSELSIQTGNNLLEGFNYNETPVSNSWRQDSYLDDFNWKYYNYTSTSATGASAPQEGHTFLHIDASHELVSANDSINLISPCFTFAASSTAEMTFYYSMYGADTGSLKVQVSQDNGGSWQNIWHKSGQQHTSGTSWSLATISLAQYTASPFQLRFSGQVIGGSKGDISLDNVSVTTSQVSKDVELDRLVDDISFADQSAVELDVLVYSQRFVISGINTEINLSIENGEYSVDCQTDVYASQRLTVKHGDTLCLRHNSASGYQEQVTTVLTLAEQKFYFVSTTRSSTQTNAEAVTTVEPVTTIDATNTSEPVTSPVPIITADATTETSAAADVIASDAVIAAIPQSGAVDTVQEPKSSAGAMMCLLLFGLVVRLNRKTKPVPLYL